MTPDSQHTRERAVGGLALVVCIAGVLAALVKGPAEDEGLRRADVDLTQVGAVAPAESALVEETTQTSAPRAGELDIASNAPEGTELTLPELAPVDFGDGAVASAPVTGGYTDLIRQYFGDATVEALVIVQCESNFVPWAVGTNTNGTQDHGLFQINDIHAAAFETVTGADWEVGRYDPEINTRFARWLHQRSGWRPWTCRDRLQSPD